MNPLRWLFGFVAVPLLLQPARALEWEKTTLAVAAKPGADTVCVSFHFQNMKRVPVQILGITTSCGCTEAMPSASDIAAGGSGAIEVVFTVGGRTGRQTKEILVRTNEAREPVKLELVVDLPAAVPRAGTK